MIRLLVVAFAALLAGCSTMTNRVYCSADQRELVFVSWYARLGVAAKVEDRDAKALCQK